MLPFLYICSIPNESFNEKQFRFLHMSISPQMCRAIRTEYGLTQPQVWISSLESILTNTSSK